MKKKPYDWRTAEHNAVVPPIRYRGHKTHVSVTYGAPNARTLARRFAGEEPGYIYMGMGEGNPTVREFERMIVATETGKVDEYDAYACATGNSAIHMLTEFMLRKKMGSDGKREEARWNVVSSAYVYGGTFNFFNAYLPQLDMECRFVDRPDDPKAWSAALTPPTKFLFLLTRLKQKIRERQKGAKKPKVFRSKYGKSIKHKFFIPQNRTKTPPLDFARGGVFVF